MDESIGGTFASAAATGRGRGTSTLNQPSIGKAFRPDGKRSAVLIPPAFGLAGVNRHTWTGWGSASYSNAYRGQLRYARQGRLFRLAAEEWDPIPDRRARISTMSVTNQCLITSKLAALQFYQLAIPAPEPPAGSFNPQAAERGKQALSGAGECATCHVPPL